jgi:hypothetical protein
MRKGQMPPNTKLLLQACHAPPRRAGSPTAPLTGSPDSNVVSNHDHPPAADIRPRTIEPYVFDPWLI